MITHNGRSQWLIQVSEATTTTTAPAAKPRRDLNTISVITPDWLLLQISDWSGSRRKQECGAHAIKTLFCPLLIVTFKRCSLANEEASSCLQE